MGRDAVAGVAWGAGVAGVGYGASGAVAASGSTAGSPAAATWSAARPSPPRPCARRPPVTPARAAQREPAVRRKSWTVLAALAIFAALAALPAILPALHLKITTVPPTARGGIQLPGAPRALPPIRLPPAARPTGPAGPTATFPQVSEPQEAAAVAFEDNRLRTMLHDSFRTYQPKIIHYRHALPTLLLTSGTHTVYSGFFHYVVPGKSVYTAADLISNGAMVRLPDGGALLKDNVFVSSGARLDLSSSGASA